MSFHCFSGSLPALALRSFRNLARLLRLIVTFLYSLSPHEAGLQVSDDDGLSSLRWVLHHLGLLLSEALANATAARHELLDAAIDATSLFGD